MAIDDVVYAKAVTSIDPVFAMLTEPPSWTRLEPVSTTGDPRPGLEARLADPLWQLARQWQFGEFRGDDAGTPVSVRIATTSQPLRGFRPAPSGAQPAPTTVAITDGMLIEPLVEREPVSALGPTLRARADAGATFLAALDDAALGTLRTPVLANASVQAPATIPATDPTLAGLLTVLVDRMADGERLALAIETARPGHPAWLTGANPSEQHTIDTLCANWLGWYRSEISPLAVEPGPDCWVDGHLEYGFDIAVATPDGEQALVATEFDGGEVDWFSLSVADESTTVLGVEAVPAISTTQRVLSSRLRFAGMPADRLFEFEDAAVNLGALEAEPHDLARLLFAEFALTYGSDWLVVPFDVPVGALNSVDSVVVTNTFNEHLVIRPAVSPTWRMFATENVTGLLSPPAAVQVIEGPDVEDVLFLRDEMANLVWAVERTVTGPSGDPHDRGTEPGTEPRTDSGHAQAVVARAELDWVLQTSTPPNWFPYLPTSDGYRQVGLIRARVEGQSPPAGRLLPEEAQRHIFDGEVPRDGVRVRRVPVLARRADGSYERWITRRVTTGRGEGWSGLAFDTAAVRRPS